MIVKNIIRLRHLKTFSEVAQAKSISRAAQNLGVTQPAVSKTMSELETILGVELIDKKRRATQLTPLGEDFLSHVESALLALRQGIDHIEEAKSPLAQPIRIGALPTVSARLLPQAIARFRHHNLHTVPYLVTGPNGYLMDALREGTLDIVIGRMGAPSQMRNLTFEHLYSEKVCLCTRPDHPLLQEDVFHAQNIAAYDFILPSSHSIIRPLVDRLLLMAGLTQIKICAETVSSSFSRSYTRQSDAIWVISEGVVLQDIADGILTKLPFDTAETLGPVGMTMRADTPMPAGLAILIKELRAIAATI